MCIKNQLNSRGMSLVETMVAAGIMGIVMMGFASYMVNAQKQQRLISMQMDRAELQGLLLSPTSGLSSMPGKCATDLANFPRSDAWGPNPVNINGRINEYKKVGANYVATAVPIIDTATGKVKGSNSLRVQGMTLKELNVLNPATGGNAKLEVNVQSPDNTAMKIKPISLNVKVTTAPVGGGVYRVSGCEATGADGTAPPPTNPVGQEFLMRPGVGTWTVPDDVKLIDVSIIGAGGGGSSASDGWSGPGGCLSGGGGGSGQIVRIKIPVTPGQRIPYNIGLGGGGSTNGGGCGGEVPHPSRAGRQGGSTTFMGISANGGEGGKTETWSFSYTDGWGEDRREHTVAGGFLGGGDGGKGCLWRGDFAADTSCAVGAGGRKLPSNGGNGGGGQLTPGHFVNADGTRTTFTSGNGGGMRNGEGSWGENGRDGGNGTGGGGGGCGDNGGSCALTAGRGIGGRGGHGLIVISWGG